MILRKLKIKTGHSPKGKNLLPKEADSLLQEEQLVWIEVFCPCQSYFPLQFVSIPFNLLIHNKFQEIETKISTKEKQKKLRLRKVSFSFMDLLVFIFNGCYSKYISDC